VQVKVENYKARRQMEKGLTSLLNSGWKIVAQSGAFSGNPLMRGSWAPKVTVTLTLDERTTGVA